MSSKIRAFGKTYNRTALGIINAYLILYPETTLRQMREIFPNSINPVSNTKEMFVDVIQKSALSKLDGYFTLEEELLVTGEGKKVAMISQWPLESLQRLIEKVKEYGIEVADFHPSKNAILCKGGYYLEFLDNWRPEGAVKRISDIFGLTMATTGIAATSPEVSAATVMAVTTSATSIPTPPTSPASAASVPTPPETDSLFGNNSTSNNNSTFNETNTTMETETSTYDDSKLNWLWVLIGLVVAGLFVWAIYNSCHAQKLYANMDGSAIMAQFQPGDATVEALPLEISQGQAQDGSAVIDPAQIQAQIEAQAQAASTIQSADGQEVDPQVYMARFVELQHQFNGIEYKNAKAALSDSAIHVLNRVAALMEEYPSLDLRIEGHTSSVGRANYNLKLSQQRAQAVATYLESKGIAADRLVAVGMGEAKPVDPANPNGSDNRVTCLFNISHNEARAQKEALGDIIAKEVAEEGPISADF